ncbi:hypothetical protein R1sor_011332 [Riccia sorocarpa]|uniref:Tyrosinase copper-binding domain-containing protein n=1 Tax=Riccia sorocarpa TaxID=122646 RepID=A0ABD3I4U1_9MARC
MAAIQFYSALPGLVQLMIIFTWMVVILIPPSAAAPIQITFEGCIPGFADNETQYCCPPKYNGTIVDFIPEKELNSSKPLRVRKALQCLSEKEQLEYKAKLDRAYTILRNLPEDDPRSLYQHCILHCAYGTGALVQPGTNITIDIHFSWLFYPFQRWFVFFHERILQNVLEDPEFSLHFWNWDNGATVRKPNSSDGGCYKVGHFVPQVYNDSSTAQYEAKRSYRAFMSDLPVDLSMIPEERADPPLRTADVVVPRNVASMYVAMMLNGSTTRGFIGGEYRVGDTQVLDPLTRGGSLEVRGHASAHWWVGGPLGLVPTSASDPLFFAHHSNVDRLWNNWHNLPGAERKDYDDPDFLNAEYLFWDETATLRRVNVRDSLSIEVLALEEVHFPTRWNKV